MNICEIGIPTYHARVEAWECDHNQHWNVRNYLRAFQQAGYVAADIAKRPVSNEATYTQHTRYHAELFQNSPIEIRSARIADGALKDATLHILTSNGILSATAIEQDGAPNLSLPQVKSEAIELALPRGIDGAPIAKDPVDISQTHPKLEHGFIQPREVDHLGSLGMDRVMRRIAASSSNLLNSLGATTEFSKTHKINRMGVETKITRFCAAPAGMCIQSTAKLAKVTDKFIVVKHSLFEANGAEIAACEQGLVFVDMTKRRVTKVPNFIRDIHIA